MKSSFIALIAAAGLVGGITSAQAADLGGDCCADLEERVAELEATTARKGNRKVSLTVSGWVNEAVMFWDDGHESNVYQTTNFAAQTRFRFLGSAKINADWTAGYLLEIGATGAPSPTLNRNTDDGQSATTPQNSIAIRHSAWWLQSKQLGKVWVGQTSSATDSITEINLANTGHIGNSTGTSLVGGFTPRTAGGGSSSFSFTQLWGNEGTGMIGEGARANVVKYESPIFAGFALSAAAGEDDMWDVALRYAGEFSGFKLAAGIGYQKSSEAYTAANTMGGNPGANAPNGPGGCLVVAAAGVKDTDCSQLGLSAAVMHVPTGLFVAGSYGQRSDDNIRRLAAGADDNHTMWYLQAGIEQNFLGFGKSTLYGEYQQIDHGFFTSRGAAAGLATNTYSGAETTMWGIGFNQSIDAAAMDLYVSYRNYSADSTACSAGTVATTCAAVGATTSYDSFQTITAGGKINF